MKYDILLSSIEILQTILQMCWLIESEVMSCNNRIQVPFALINTFTILHHPHPIPLQPHLTSIVPLQHYLIRILHYYNTTSYKPNTIKTTSLHPVPLQYYLIHTQYLYNTTSSTPSTFTTLPHPHTTPLQYYLIQTQHCLKKLHYTTTSTSIVDIITPILSFPYTLHQSHFQPPLPATTTATPKHP